MRDIGERVAHERAREAQRAVSQALAEAGAGEDVVPRLLEALGRYAALAGGRALGAGPARRRAAPRGASGATRPTTAASCRSRVSVPIGDGPTGSARSSSGSAAACRSTRASATRWTSIAELVAEVLERRRAEAETERLKDEFFALVSHELRTPLTSIIGYLELMLEEEAGEVSARAAAASSTVVERNARRLLRLVGDLLFVAQVEAGTLSLEQRGVDLEAVVRDAVEAGRPRAEQAGVELVRRDRARAGARRRRATGSRRWSTT